MLWCGVRISQWPAPKSQLRVYPRHVLTPWQLVCHSHNEFTDISVSDRQPAFIPQLRGNRSNFLSGEPSGKQRKQGDIVAFGNSLRIACP